MRATAIIVAAGRGERAGGALPKQFRPCAGRPLVAHALHRFCTAPGIEAVILVLPQVDDLDRHLHGAAAWPRPVTAVQGGAQRQDSVAAGLAAVSDDDSLVLVHDGARPVVSEALIKRVLRAAAAVGAAVPVVPCADTVKEIAAGRVRATLDRQRLGLAQTPQGFRAGLLRRAHREARMAGVSSTDDAALVERLGAPVAVVEGEVGNIKVTCAEDLAAAEWWLGRAPGAPVDP